MLIQGDCIGVMKTLDANSVDTILTDPPYGLSFMGKEWDVFSDNEKLQAWTKSWATEALRVAKPGAMMLCFGGTRTFHRIACGIEDAGWKIKDTMMWIYGSGFPKSHNISKAIDKRNGRFYDLGFQKYCNDRRLEKGYSHIKVNELMRVATSGGGFSSAIMGNKIENLLPTLEMYQRLKPILELDDRYDELIEKTEAEREVVGSKSAGMGSGETFGMLQTEGENSNKEKNTGIVDVTAPATDSAKLWDGWGTALKPAFEPIIVAMKPRDGTFAENALKWGVAGLNIDGGRVPTEDSVTINTWDNGAKPFGNGAGNPYSGREETKGRWPANLLHDGSEEVVSGFPDRKSGTWTYGGHGTRRVGVVGLGNLESQGKKINDSGSAARFFYCAKASKAERNQGLKGIKESKRDESRHADQPSMNDGEGNPYNRGAKLVTNNHPTVKPLALMEYLCRLTKTPTGGIVLDPFMGSGTTGIACKQVGRDFIGIELDEHYFEIAEKRIASVIQQELI